MVRDYDDAGASRWMSADDVIICLDLCIGVIVFALTYTHIRIYIYIYILCVLFLYVRL